MTTSQEWAAFLLNEALAGGSTVEGLTQERNELDALVQDPKTSASDREEARSMLTGANGALTILQQAP